MLDVGAPCGPGETRAGCLDAGEHVCGTEAAFTLPPGPALTECPGCTPQSPRSTRYCARHGSKVSLAGVRAARDASPPPPVPPGIDGDLVAEARRRYPYWEWGVQSDDYDTFLDAARWTKGFLERRAGWGGAHAGTPDA